MNEQSRKDRQPGLYRREFEHDACGVGMVANLSGEASHDIVEKGMTILKRLMHRGATGNDPETGDGAGLAQAVRCPPAGHGGACPAPPSLPFPPHCETRRSSAPPAHFSAA
ncbi:MAG: hypothetical protein IJ983_03420, partial [Kiritimatiellae bacterium]|nr:hypothetical protein [Kiritimatiellia bacterium]